MLDLNGTREKCLSLGFHFCLLLVCIHCSSPIQLSKSSARALFLSLRPRRLSKSRSNKNRPKGSRDSIVAPPLKSSKEKGRHLKLGAAPPAKRMGNEVAHKVFSAIEAWFLRLMCPLIPHKIFAQVIWVGALQGSTEERSRPLSRIKEGERFCH